MIKQITLFAITVFFSAGAYAYGPEEITPHFSWVTNADAQTGVDAFFGVGLLNGDFTTGSGTSFFFDAIGNYAINDQLAISLQIPLAGTLSENNDGVGLGNISLAAKYFFASQGSTIFGVAADFAFATATDDAFIGTATRKFYRYGQDQWAIVPRVIAGIENDNLRLTGQVGLPVQMLESAGQFDGDAIETSISYDIGAAVAIDDTRGLWVVIEAGGYSTFTRSNSAEQTEIFGSLGTQYQDDEKSFGLSLAVPFTEDVRDVHSMLIYGNFAYHF